MKAEWAKVMKEGGLTLPVCQKCSTVQYPLRDVCVQCLSDALEWAQVDNTGEVLATTVLHYSLEEKFKSQLPLHVASVKLASGPVLMVFGDPALKAGQGVTVVNRKTGEAEVALFALTEVIGARR
jgi:uncharacterized OB-fold protein